MAKKFPKSTPASVPTKSVISAVPAAVPVIEKAPVAEKSEVKGLGKPKAPVAAAREVTHDDIAKRAYEIYASRGYAAGDPSADWHEAERQLKAGL